MKRFAVTWYDGREADAGRLEIHPDRLELHGRTKTTRIALADVRCATIARGPADRLHGLPVLRLETYGGEVCSIASLEGAGVLHELAALKVAV